MLFPPRETCLEGMTEDLRIPKSREPITYDRTPDTVTTAVRGSGYSGRMIPAVRLQNPPSSGRLAKTATGERHMRVSIRIHRYSLSKGQRAGQASWIEHKNQRMFHASRSNAAV